MLEINTSVEGSKKVLALIGELDIATVDLLKKSVEEAREDSTGIILNMEMLSFVDSTGVGGLMNVIKHLLKDNVEVKVHNVSSEVYEVFDILGLPMIVGKDIFEVR